MKINPFLKKSVCVLLSLVMLTSMPLSSNAETLAERLDYTDDSAISNILFDTYYYTKTETMTQLKRSFIKVMIKNITVRLSRKLGISSLKNILV